MENTSILNEEKLVNEIKVLKNDIATANNELQPILGNMKLEEHKKNVHTVRIETLKNEINYYSKQSMLKARNRLRKAEEINWQFSVADQCYERYMKDIEDNYLEIFRNSDIEDKDATIGNQLLDSKEIEDYQIKIDANNCLIDSILDDLEELK